MTSKIVIELIDDLDGKPAVETMSFALDNTTYEIDLSEKNATALRTALAPWTAAARRIGGRQKRTATTQVATAVDPKAVRAWATSNGIELSPRGRVPAVVVEQFRAAGN